MFRSLTGWSLPVTRSKVHTADRRMAVPVVVCVSPAAQFVFSKLLLGSDEELNFTAVEFLPVTQWLGLLRPTVTL